LSIIILLGSILNVGNVGTDVVVNDNRVAIGPLGKVSEVISKFMA